MPLFAAWHKAHPMPKNPTLEGRIAWHEEHSRECNCRQMPRSIREAIARRDAPKPDSRGSQQAK